MKAYARCKACDTPFYPHPIDDSFEDMCKGCIDKSEEDTDHDKDFLEGYLQDKREDYV